MKAVCGALRACRVRGPRGLVQARDVQRRAKATKGKIAEPTADIETMPVEQMYAIVPPHEHVLLRPETYVGSPVPTEPRTEWIVNADQNVEVLHDVTCSPALLKICDEIFVNAADNYWRHSEEDRTTNIDYSWDAKTEMVIVSNDGRPPPVVWHRTARLWTPTLLFGRFKSGQNFDDTIERVTGGKNGLGAKATNVFSTIFEVDIQDCHEGKQRLVQRWVNNMNDSEEIKKTPCTLKASRTTVRFRPDWLALGCRDGKPPQEIEGLLRRRAMEIAAVNPGITVTFNNEKLHCSSLQKLTAKLLDVPENKKNAALGGKLASACSVWFPFTDLKGNDWDIGVGPPLTFTPNGDFAFANGIPTTLGTHIDCIRTQLSDRLESLLRLRKHVTPRATFVARNIGIFVSARVANPVFDSQTKENLKGPTARQMSKFVQAPVDRMFPKLMDDNGCDAERIEQAKATDALLDYLTEKYKSEMSPEEDETEEAEVTLDENSVPLVPGGLPEKLIDASLAGSSKSHLCTLIIAEGDSARSLALAGLEALPHGSEKYGVYSLGGKIMQAARWEESKAAESKAIQGLCQALGLKWREKYLGSDKRKLRYGKILLMCDQDADGGHIKGLIVSLLWVHWPELLQCNDYVYFMRTPIVKVSRGTRNIKEFFSVHDFKEWKRTDGKRGGRYKVKYYKGLGTSTNEEGMSYFKRLGELQQQLIWDKDANASLGLAFLPSKTAARKEWMTKDRYQLDPTKPKITVTEFIHTDVKEYGKLANIRQIPNAIDGLKQSQRKLLFTSMKNVGELKVAQLVGQTIHTAGYSHGEESLSTTAIRMAQDFPGIGNNLPLFRPGGAVGTRLSGGDDHASPRYVSTSAYIDLLRLIYPKADMQHLANCEDDGIHREPAHYVPVLPMALVNCRPGIGYGWSSDPMPFNPVDLIDWNLSVLDGKPTQTLMPWFLDLGYTTSSRKWQYSDGKAHWSNVAGAKTIVITDLPAREWTENYRGFLDKCVAQGNIKRWRETGGSEREVEFTVDLKADGHYDRTRPPTEQPEIRKTLRLRKRMNMEGYVFFNSSGVVENFESPEEVLLNHHNRRIKLYAERIKSQVLQQKETVEKQKQRQAVLEWLKQQHGADFADPEGIARELVRDGVVKNEAAALLVIDALTAADALSDGLAKAQQNVVSQKQSLATLQKMTPKALFANELQQIRRYLTKRSDYPHAGTAYV